MAIFTAIGVAAALGELFGTTIAADSFIAVTGALILNVTVAAGPTLGIAFAEKHDAADLERRA